MSLLASLIPVGLSMLGGGSKRKSVQQQVKPSEGAVPKFSIDAGNALSSFVSQFLPQFEPGKHFSGDLSADISPAELSGQGFLSQFLD